MPEMVTLYRFGNAEGRGYYSHRHSARYWFVEYQLMHKAVLDIRCPFDDRYADTGRKFDDLKGSQYCWLSFDQLTHAAKLVERDYCGTLPSFMFTDLWVMEFPVEACTFLMDQVLVDYDYGEED